MSDQPPTNPTPQTGGTGPTGIPGADKKMVAGILGILLGGFGVHKFYLGYQKEGIILLVVTLVTCGAAHIIGIIEGVLYLTKTDQEFVDTYVNGRKGWF